MGREWRIRTSDGAFGDELRHFREQLEGVLQVLDHFVGQIVRAGKLEPEKVEVELVAFFKFPTVVRAAATLRIVFAPSGLGLL